MNTEIVNIRRTPADEIDVYIDRRSDYGNPFKMESDGGDYTRDGCIAAFRDYWYSEEQAELRARAEEELKGNILGCWCKPKACHGDVLIGFLHGKECTECGRKHSDWIDKGQTAVRGEFHAGTIDLYECPYCGASMEVAKR